MVRGKLRAVLRRLHLSLTLVFGGLFVMSGLTGCALVWMHELDSMLNPALFRAETRPASGREEQARAPQVVQRIVDRLGGDPAYGRPTMLTLPERAGEVAVAWYRSPPMTNKSTFAIDAARQVMIDPVTLAVTGERNWGEPGVSRPLLMQTIYHVHRYLLAGATGKTVIGIAGLALLLLALLGIALWWPKPGLSAWRKAFTVGWHGSWPGFNYRAHRAAGAVLAPVLLMLGFSGAFFNVPQWVTPVVGLVAPLAPNDKPSGAPPGDRAQVSVARAVQAAQEAFPAARISRVAFPAKPGMPYEIRARQPGERRQGGGNTRVTIDAATAQVLRVRDPLHALPGDAFLDWQFPLHSGEAFGMASRCFMTLAGLAPLGFFVSGIAIWRRRRR